MTLAQLLGAVPRSSSSFKLPAFLLELGLELGLPLDYTARRLGTVQMHDALESDQSGGRGRRRTHSSGCQLVNGVFWDVLTYLLKQHLVTRLSYQDRTHFPVTSYTKQINADTELGRETGAWDK